MIVEQIWMGNTLRNFNYLVVCPETGDALAIDPLDYASCLKRASENSWRISKILNTHEHADHIGGNRALIAKTKAQLIAHRNAADRIPGMDRGVAAGDIIKVGSTVELECLDTPGHTMRHICLLSRTDRPAIFSGDTLFNAGAGNCHNGGHPEALYRTFSEQLESLDDETLIYPGHDYLANNLRFTLDREPDNETAAALLDQFEHQDPNNAFVTSMSKEREINTFFRLQNSSVISRLQETNPEVGNNPSAKDVFLKLRELRNRW